MKTSFYLKIGMMVLALVGVFYVIGALNSGSLTKKASDPQSALGILIGGDYRPLNWCPVQTQKVEIFAESGELLKALETPADIAAVCEIMMGAFSSEGIHEASYKKRLVAQGSEQAEIVILEQVPGQSVFRVKGMPFSSPMLAKALDRLAIP